MAGRSVTTFEHLESVDNAKLEEYNPAPLTAKRSLMQASPRFSNHSMIERTTVTGTTVLVRQEKMMKYLNFKVRLLAGLAILCFFAGITAKVAHAQTPTSGAMLTIDGTVAAHGTSGATHVHLVIYDSQIHSGNVQTPPCDPNFPTDAYVLQGGSWTGCDAGDDYEVTDGNILEGAHQNFGKADLIGTGYSFHIETHYVCANVCTDVKINLNLETAYCNTSGTICASPDDGFLTVTNNSGAAFAGTITLQGNSPGQGGLWCPAGGVAFDSWTTGLTASEEGSYVRLGLGSAGAPADSSNCGGFNAPQTITLVPVPGANKVQIGGDDFQITPFLGGVGDSLTVLPIPVPA